METRLGPDALHNSFITLGRGDTAGGVYDGVLVDLCVVLCTLKTKRKALTRESGRSYWIFISLI